MLLRILLVLAAILNGDMIFFVALVAVELATVVVLSVFPPVSSWYTRADVLSVIKSHRCYSHEVIFKT